MRKDGRALLVKPLVAVRMVEMPMGVYQVFDRIAAEVVDGIDKQFAVGAW